jgi:hypothetical protein
LLEAEATKQGLCLIKADSVSFAPKSILTDCAMRDIRSQPRRTIKGTQHMKRDMDLVRLILIALEDAPFDGGPLSLTIPDRNQDELSYHVMLLHQAGLIHAFDFSGDSFVNWQPAYLTWEGQEFLEAAKDDTRWNRAKGYLAEKGSPMIFEVLKALLLGYVNQKVFGSK